MKDLIGPLLTIVAMLALPFIAYSVNDPFVSWVCAVSFTQLYAEPKKWRP